MTKHVLTRLTWHIANDGDGRRYTQYADGDYWCRTMYIIRPVSGKWQLEFRSGRIVNVTCEQLGEPRRYLADAKRAAHDHAATRGCVTHSIHGNS